MLFCAIHISYVFYHAEFLIEALSVSTAILNFSPSDVTVINNYNPLILSPFPYPPKPS